MCIYAHTHTSQNKTCCFWYYQNEELTASALRNSSELAKWDCLHSPSQSTTRKQVNASTIRSSPYGSSHRAGIVPVKCSEILQRYIGDLSRGYNWSVPA